MPSSLEALLEVAAIERFDLTTSIFNLDFEALVVTVLQTGGYRPGEKCAQCMS